MQTAFQRDAFQNNAFQIGIDAEELRGHIRRRWKQYLYTDDQVRKDVEALLRRLRGVADEVPEVALAQVARQQLIELIPILDIPDAEPARREAARLIRQLRSNRRALERLEEEELAIVLSIL